MDYKSYLDFIIALENRNERERKRQEERNQE
jgi:hypothetical protein